MSGKRGYGKLHYDTVSTKEARIDAERMWRELPSDTRGLTARICGDPIPGRSALDRRRNGLVEIGKSAILLPSVRSP